MSRFSSILSRVWNKSDTHSKKPDFEDNYKDFVYNIVPYMPAYKANLIDNEEFIKFLKEIVSGPVLKQLQIIIRATKAPMFMTEDENVRREIAEPFLEREHIVEITYALYFITTIITFLYEVLYDSQLSPSPIITKTNISQLLENKQELLHKLDEYLTENTDLIYFFNIPRIKELIKKNSTPPLPAQLPSPGHGLRTVGGKYKLFTKYRTVKKVKKLVTKKNYKYTRGKKHRRK